MQPSNREVLNAWPLIQFQNTMNPGTGKTYSCEQNWDAMLSNLKSTNMLSGSTLPLLGPTIVIASVSALVIPYILSLSTNTLMLLTSAIFGIAITITDVCSIVASYYKEFRMKVIKYGNDLIIDDLMCDMLGAEGWMIFFWGSWIGTFLLYMLPFDKHLRLRITRNVFKWGNDQNDANGMSNMNMDVDEYVDRVLFQPGGVWKLFNADDSEAEVEEVVASPVYDHTGPVRVGNDLEMSWDTEADNRHDESLRRNGNADDHNEHSTVDTGTSTTSSLPLQVQLIKKEKRQSSPSIQDDSIEHIFVDVIRNLAKGVLGLEDASNNEDPHRSSRSDTLLQRVSVGASILLFLQLRYSTTARKTIYHMVNGSVAVGLASIVSGSLVSTQVKKQLIEWVLQQGSSSNSRVRERVPQPMPFTNQGQDEQVPGWIGLLQKKSLLIISRLRNDPKFKHQWKGVIALIVLAYFQHRKGLGGRRISTNFRSRYS